MEITNPPPLQGQLDFESTDSAFNLFAILAAATNEVFVIDTNTLKFLSVSTTALKQLNRTLQEIQALTLEEVFYQYTNTAIRQRIDTYRHLNNVVQPIATTTHPLNDELAELQLVYVKEGGRDVLIAIREKVSKEKHSYQVQEKNALYKDIVSDIPSLVFQGYLDDTGSLSFTYLSDNCLPLLGLSAEKLYAASAALLKLIIPKDRESFVQSMRMSAEKRLVWNWEGGLWIEAWQDIKLVNLRASPRLNEHGQIVWSGVINNISQSKKEKLELDEMTSRFQAIVSNIPSLVFQCYLNAKDEISFNYLSDGCQALLGLDPEKLYCESNTLIEMIVPSDRELFLESMRASARNLEVWNWEGGLWIEEWRDVKLVNLRASPRINNHGQVQWGGVITNITQSKKEKQELDELTSRFQAIVSNIPSLVFQCHIDTGNQFEFDYLSEGCEALLGIEQETLYQHPEKLLNIVLPKDRDSFYHTMKTSADELSVWNWEGGLWIEKWQDVKLVNLRATPRINSQGFVQWGGVITNITQSQNEKREIEESHKQLAELSSHMSLVKEQERLRIAREIHDDLGGNLTAIKMGLSSLYNALPKEQKALIEKAKQLETIVDKTFDDAHRITSDLRPNILELGIVAALEWQSREFEKQIGIPCDFYTNNDQIDLNDDQSIVLFRICQEAMSNIAKHAHANLVDVKLTLKNQTVTMEIHDDGVGIAPANKLKKNAFGLLGMAERVASVNGEFEIESQKDKGTIIRVKIDLTKATTS